MDATVRTGSHRARHARRFVTHRMALDYDSDPIYPLSDILNQYAMTLHRPARTKRNTMRLLIGYINLTLPIKAPQEHTILPITSTIPKQHVNLGFSHSVLCDTKAPAKA